MQIVINIDEEIYKRMLPYKDVPVISNLCNDYPEITYAIANGMPIPRGHGRIGDLDRLYNVFEKNIVSANAFKELFDHAPTIIEADRSEEE